MNSRPAVHTDELHPVFFFWSLLNNVQLLSPYDLFSLLHIKVVFNLEQGKNNIAKKSTVTASSLQETAPDDVKGTCRICQNSL